MPSRHNFRSYAVSKLLKDQHICLRFIRPFMIKIYQESKLLNLQISLSLTTRMNHLHFAHTKFG